MRQSPPSLTSKVPSSIEASARACSGDSLIPLNLTGLTRFHQIFFGGEGRFVLADAEQLAILSGGMRYRTVLFDLDGTLIDHFAAIHRSHTYAMRQLGLPVPTMAQVRAAVGGGLEQAIARLAGPENVAAIIAI